MTAEELESLIKNATKQGLKKIPLVIKRKSGPTGFKIRVKGMGLGEIMNVQKRDDGFDICALFEIYDVKHYARLNGINV